MSDPSEDKNNARRDAGSGGEPGKPDRPTGRKLAEWLTLGLSIVLVLGVAAFLLYSALQDHPRFVPLGVRVLTEAAREGAGGQFIVPVEVRNLGRRSLKAITIRFTHASADGTEESGDFIIDHLGEGATHQAYLFLDQPPTAAKPEAEVSDYQLE
jgi:uncharacterized protein (TIGR02588 family)